MFLLKKSLTSTFFHFSSAKKITGLLALVALLSSRPLFAQELFPAENFTPATNVELVELPELSVTPLRKLEQTPFFLKQKEVFKFKITFWGITAGYSTLLADPSYKPEAVLLKIEARTAEWVENIYRLRMALTSKSLKENLQTVQYEINQLERKRYRYSVQDFNLENNFYTFRRTSERGKFQQEKKVTYFPGGGLSVVGSFYYSRTLPLKIGETYRMRVFFQDKQYEVVVRVLRREKIKTHYGYKQTLVIQPRLKFDGLFTKQGEMFIYLSDDEYKAPLLMHTSLPYGTFRATLVEGYLGKDGRK